MGCDRYLEEYSRGERGGKPAGETTVYISISVPLGNFCYLPHGKKCKHFSTKDGGYCEIFEEELQYVPHNGGYQKLHVCKTHTKDWN